MRRSELDLIKAARQAVRQARENGGNRVLTATLDMLSIAYMSDAADQ
jgi:hypothetical protein